MDCSIHTTDIMYSTIQNKETQKKLEQPADISFPVKTAHVTLPVLTSVVETKSKDYSSKKRLLFRFWEKSKPTEEEKLQV